MKTEIHPAGLGRGTHPNSRKNLMAKKTKWLVMEQQEKTGRWTKFWGPTTQRTAFNMVGYGNTLIAKGDLHGVTAYAAIAA